MCRRATAFLIVLFFMLVPFSVFAEEGSLGGDLLPEAVNNPTVQRIGVTDTYFVYAPSNEFDAALAIIGETSTKIQLDTPKFTALSNESTGGDFYDLAQLCYSAEDGNPVNPQSLVWYPMVEAKIGLFGASHVWFCEATEEQIRAARRDYLTVLEGGSLGGGGNGPVVETEDYIVVPCRVLFTGTNNSNRFNMVDTSGQIYCNIPNYGTEYRDLPNVINFRIRKSLFNSNTLSQHVITDACVRFTSISGSSGTVNNGTVQIRLISNSSSRVIVSLNDYSFTKDGQSYSGKYYGSAVEPANSYSMSYTVSGQYFSFDGTTITDISTNTSSSRWVLDSSEVTVFSGDNRIAGCTSGESGGGGGDNHWPDPTPIPKPIAPEVPWFEPGDPVTDPTDPVDIIFSPTFVYEPTGTSPTDYTPWLRAILQALNTIIDDMATHCDHIRVAIRDWTQWLSQRIDYLMYEYLGDLQTYLHQLFEWLADEMSFNFDAGDFPLYDDTRLIAWLRRIYYRLGSPVKVNTDVPSDKDVEQGFDFWAWLLNLVNGLLGGIIEDFVGDVGGFLTELVGTFPFSVPWDVLAYLTLLSAQRETPRIVVTIPAVSGWWSSYDVVIDCAPFDGAAAAVRSMVLIWWGFVLVMRTSWLDEIFRGATSLVTGFFDRVTGKVVSD